MQQDKQKCDTETHVTRQTKMWHRDTCNKTNKNVTQRHMQQDKQKCDTEK